MGRSFLPNADSALLLWSEGFGRSIAEDPEVVGLTPEACAAFNVLQAAFAGAVLACEPSIRSKAAVTEKNARRSALREAAGNLAMRIKSDPNVSCAKRQELGLAARSRPSRRAGPQSKPGVQLGECRGGAFPLRLFDKDANGSRRKPRDACGALVFYCLGEAPAVDRAGWSFLTSTGRCTLDVVPPVGTAAGTKLWVTAAWLGTRMDAGPWADPAYAFVPMGGLMRVGRAA